MTAKELRTKTGPVNRQALQLADAERDLAEARAEAAEWKRIADEIERRYNAIVPQQKLRDARIADLTAYWATARQVVDAAKIVVAKHASLIERLDRRLANGGTIEAGGELETYIAERALRDALVALDAAPVAGKAGE